MTGRGGRLLQQILAKKEAEEGKKTRAPPPTLLIPQQQVEDAPQPQQSLQQQTGAQMTTATLQRVSPIEEKLTKPQQTHITAPAIAKRSMAIGRGILMRKAASTANMPTGRPRQSPDAQALTTQFENATLAATGASPELTSQDLVTIPHRRSQE
jgi:hypothetical protein